MIAKVNRALLAATLLVCTAAAQAQRVDATANLRNYAEKVLPRCPAGSVVVEPLPGGSPANFQLFAVTARSSDQYCGSKKYLLYSPKSQQVLIGTVLQLPKDNRAANLRITEEASRLLGKQVVASIAPFALPDGIKQVSITRETPFGPFSYLGFVDQSERFLIVGFRGLLTSDPAKVLRDALGSGNGARRGNASSKVEIVELSDFQCPTCANAHAKLEPYIKQNLGNLNYVRLDLPLFEHHEWAVQAAMGARALQKVAPAKYWAYVDYIFKNQESIGTRGNFDQVLRDWADDNDVEWAAINRVYSSKPERQALLEQVSRAFAIGIASTPTFIVNGQIMGFGPDGQFTIDAIKTAVNNAKATPTAKKAATKKTAPKPKK